LKRNTLIAARDFTVRLLAAFVLSWPMMMLEFLITLVTRWTWLGYIFITPGFAVRDVLVKLRVLATPISGGHMPDLGPAIAFNLILNFMIVLVLLYVFPNFLKSFFPKSEHA
jgi:hypothetical protein